MAQHDQVIDNGSGLTVRTDFNSAIAALFSNSSGPVEPAVTVAGQFWWDTANASNPVLRQRNLANTGWMTISQGGQSAIDIAAGKRPGPPKDTFVWNDKLDLSGTDVMTLDDTGNLTIGGSVTALGAASFGSIDMKGQPVNNAAAVGQRGFLYGCGMTYNSNTAVDIGAGAAASDAAVPTVMTVPALTKRIDAIWAVGSGNGGLDTGTLAANATYHAFAIQRPDTGVVDVLLSLSVAAPVMPANYTRKRRLFSIIREGGVTLRIRQYGDIFKRDALLIAGGLAPYPPMLTTMNVPTGIECQPICIAGGAVNTANGSVFIQFGDASLGTADTIIINVGNVVGVVNYITAPPVFTTNTAGQIWISMAGSNVTDYGVNTIGWIDTRGRT